MGLPFAGAAGVTGESTPTEDGRDPASEADLLIAFLRERDETCPRCGYNLRNLTLPRCPECEEPLVLAVKAQELNLVPYVTTLAPGIFCGLLLLVFIIMMMVGGGVPGALPFGVCLFLVFLAVSGGASLVLVGNSRGFLRLKQNRQAGIAMFTWVVHIIIFSVMIAWMFSW